MIYDIFVRTRLNVELSLLIVYKSFCKNKKNKIRVKKLVRKKKVKKLVVKKSLCEKIVKKVCEKLPFSLYIMMNRTKSIVLTVSDIFFSVLMIKIIFYD